MNTRPIVLITGFEPFGGESANPSWEIARRLDAAEIAGHKLVAAALPTEFARALPVLQQLLRQHRPTLVLALGQAGGRAEISIERVAINLIDARIADNAGAQPVDVPVIEKAPNAYFSTLPIKAMLARLRDAGIPATLSHTAGTFVCNQVFFGLMHMLAVDESPSRAGFVHVPYLPEQAERHSGAPCMALETMVQAVRLALEAALTTERDSHFAAGSTH